MKKYLKNSLLSLGAIGTVVAPIASSISCGGKNNKVDHYKLLPTYAGQADQLIALGIKADYYPLQLSQSVPFGYLTNPSAFISKSHDQGWVNKFSEKVKSLIPNERDTAWWNQQALADDEVGSNPEFWTHKQGDLVLYEHYLLDDGVKTINAATAPKHYDSPSTFIQTNFRQSRDPYTRISKAIILGLLDDDSYKKLSQPEKDFIGEMLDAARQVEGTEDNATAVDGKPKPNGKLKDGFEFKDGDKGSWLYNDYNFAKNYHEKFIDDSTFTSSEFNSIVLDTKTQWIFDKDPAKNAKLAKLFYDSTYQEEEEKLKTVMTNDANNPQMKSSPNPVLNHHPIYDQQTELGAAPMFEGAQRDNSLYLYDLASKLQKATTNQLGDKDGFERLQKAFNNNDQWQGMTHALDNANKIEKDLKARQQAIKVLVDKLTTKNGGNAPTFGIVTIAPSQKGVSTIQSSSKYSFLYRELGFAQPLPKSFDNIGAADGGSDMSNPDDGKTGNTLFNMDDNGWWWNVSIQDKDGSSQGVNSTVTSQFDKFKYGALTVNEGKDYTNLKKEDLAALNELFDDKDHTKHKVDYNLWNEGLKTPFVMHMILDYVVDSIVADAKAAGATDDEIKTAYNWGDYFTKDFIA